VAAYLNGQQVKFRLPATMDEAVRLAIKIENAERKWPSDRRDFGIDHVGTECFNCHWKGHISRDCEARSYVRPRRDSNPWHFRRSGWTAELGSGRIPMVSRGWTKPSLPRPRIMRDRQQHRGTGNPNAKGPVSRPQLLARPTGGSSRRKWSI
jgi:hypothetical protein